MPILYNQVFKQQLLRAWFCKVKDARGLLCLLIYSISASEFPCNGRVTAIITTVRIARSFSSVSLFIQTHPKHFTKFSSKK